MVIAGLVFLLVMVLAVFDEELAPLAFCAAVLGLVVVFLDESRLASTELSASLLVSLGVAVGGALVVRTIRKLRETPRVDPPWWELPPPRIVDDEWAGERDRATRSRSVPRPPRLGSRFGKRPATRVGPLVRKDVWRG